MEKTNKQQLIAYLASCVTPERLERMHQVLPLRTRHLTVLLEDIYQPHNASAIVRSVECFGVQDIHIVEQSTSFKANQGVSMGGFDWLTTSRYKKLDQAFSTLRKSGYRIVATTPHAQAYSLPDLPLDQKTALVFGTEHLGLSSYALEHADTYVTIPMYGFTQSFNVSVSVALCLYALTQKLRSPEYPWQLSEEETTDLYLSWLRSSVRGSDLLEKRFFEGK
jgi:tRNA (guanosine-2'-O-)-methyltransferase